MLFAHLKKMDYGDTKKYEVFVHDQNFTKTKNIKFGEQGYQDFTIHNDVDRKRLYDFRHSKKEDWNNVYTAGFWSKWLLWNKPTLSQSIQDIENRFDIMIFVN